MTPFGISSHRCGLTGEDLNRRWTNPNRIAHPSIYHTKGLFEYIRRVICVQPFLFVDLHGHSRKKNVFLYGCSPTQSWLPTDLKRFDDPEIYLVRGAERRPA